MSKIVKPSTPKGMRDFLPKIKSKRDYVFNIIKEIFKKYGYHPLETSSIEKLEVLTGKYGEEGEKLIFKILKRGTELEKVGKEIKEYTITDFNQITDLALRYDLSIPLSRVVAMYYNELTFPFKRYQIQPVWRADKPQKGRYREFYQCDIDVVGSDSMIADAEIIAITNEILNELKFKKFTIKINNRKILNGIIEYCGIDKTQSSEVLISLDKLDKIGKDGVKEDLKKRGIEDKYISKLIPLLELKSENPLNEIANVLKNSAAGIEGVTELKLLLKYLKDFDMPSENFEIDLFLARGLDYYTGPIYESVVKEPKIGSLTGGGRYDKLIGMFLGKDIPATGTTIGIERIIDVMDELNMFADTGENSKILVTTFSEEHIDKTIEITNKLRNKGIRTELYLNHRDKIKKQFKYANNYNIPYVIVLGPEEIKKSELSVKNMDTGKQITIKQSEFFDNINKYIY